MKLLLDTHALIWFLEDNPRLSPEAKSLIEDINNEVFVSTASWFEICIKIVIGKLELPESFGDTFRKSTENYIETIDISKAQLASYLQLPLSDSHRDPFDRLIIATAILEGCKLISSDPKFGLYKELVQVIW
jgi:PIN domain nuclease of toxin-antitoxin system